MKYGSNLVDSEEHNTVCWSGPEDGGGETLEESWKAALGPQLLRTQAHNTSA